MRIPRFLHGIIMKISSITLFEKLLILILIMVSGMAYFLMYVNAIETTKGYIKVKQDNETILQLTSDILNKDGIYDFTFDRGIGLLEVKDRRVRVLPMDKAICPRGICSDTGWIANNSKIIVCLPNKLVVSIEGGENTSSMDEMTF